MAKGLLIVAATFCLVASTCSQITGTYPVQLTATGAPNPVDGTQLSNYPLCAQICRPPTSPDLPPLCPAPVDNRCECGPANRGNSSACEALTCNDADYLTAAALAPDLCQSLYDADPSYSAAVSTAIASATSAALKAVATANPLDFSTYPPCARSCIPPALQTSGCLGPSDLECICRCPILDQDLGPCELSTCPSQDLQTIAFLVQNLCAPVGGQQPKNLASCRVVGNASTTGGLSSATLGNGTVVRPTGTGSPVKGTSVPFTGQGSMVSLEAILLGVVVGGASILVWNL